MNEIPISVYLATIAILSGIIVAFVIHSLKSNKRDYEAQKKIADLQRQNNDLLSKDREAQEKITALKTQNSNLQVKITNHRKVLSPGIAPASVSSPPEPNDYRAKRTSWLFPNGR